MKHFLFFLLFPFLLLAQLPASEAAFNKSRKDVEYGDTPPVSLENMIWNIRLAHYAKSQPPSSRRCPADIREKIDASTNLTELLVFMKHEQPPVRVYAADQVNKIPFNLLISQTNELSEIYEWYIETEQLRTRASCLIPKVYNEICNTYDFRKNQAYRDKIEHISTWPGLFEQSMFKINIGDYVVAQNKAHQLPITPDDVELFRNIIRTEINRIEARTLGQLPSDEKSQPRVQVEYAFQFLAKGSPSQETADLLKEYLIKLRLYHFSRKSSALEFCFDDIIVYIYDMNMEATDIVLFEFLKEFAKLGSMFPDCDLSLLDLMEPSYVRCLELLCDLLRDAQVNGITVYLEGLSKNLDMHSRVLDKAKQSVEWRKQNSKYQ